MKIIDQANNQASLFMTNILKKVWAKSSTKNLTNYYSPMLKVHYHDKIYDLKEVINKINFYQKNIELYKRLEIIIENAVNFDNFIMAQLVQLGFDGKLKKYFLVRCNVIYRLESQLIQEVWLTSNVPMPYEAGCYDYTTPSSEMKNAANFSLKIVPKAISKRELDCLLLVLDGKSAKEISTALKISQRTVETYMEKLKLKIGCHTKHELRNKMAPLGLWV